MAYPLKVVIYQVLFWVLHIYSFTHLILIITLGDRHFLLNLNFADERNGGMLSYASKAIELANGKA